MTGSINIPIFRFVTGDAFWDRVKKIAMSSFAMKATGAFAQHHTNAVCMLHAAFSLAHDIP